jgi:diguanylate cyclase (GGDEF)-like protein
VDEQGAHDPAADRVTELASLVEQQADEIRLLRLQLEVLSTVDGATGLLNRNGIVDTLDLALHRLRRQREPFAVISAIFDVLERGRDHDPDEMESALQHVAALFKTALRQMDRIGRLDGALFVAILPLTGSAPDYQRALDRLASVLSAAPVVIGGADHEVNPRFTVVHVAGEEPPEVEDILGLLEAGRAAATVERPATFLL